MSTGKNNKLKSRVAFKDNKYCNALLAPSLRHCRHDWTDENGDCAEWKKYKTWPPPFNLFFQIQDGAYFAGFLQSDVMGTPRCHPTISVAITTSEIWSFLIKSFWDSGAFKGGTVSQFRQLTPFSQGAYLFLLPPHPQNLLI